MPGQIVAALFHLVSYHVAIQLLRTIFKGVLFLWEEVFSSVVVVMYLQVLHFSIRYALHP